LLLEHPLTIVKLPGVGGAGLIDYIIAAAFLAIIGMAAMQSVREKNEGLKKFYVLFISSSLIILAGCIFTSLNTGMGTARYLTFMALLVLMIISFAFSRSNRVYAALIVLLLVAGAALNITAAASLDYKPNDQEQELISYLGSVGLSFGYGDYWDANVITYLSSENVTILPVSFTDGRIAPVQWLTCERWYDHRPAEYFIIVRKDSPDSDFMKAYVMSKPALEKLEYGNYDIYRFNDSSIYDSWHFSSDTGLQRALRTLSGKGIDIPFSG
jgi:hypothetical protein